MWHERTRELQAAGAVRMAGIIQEQHPDRARLFMRWKRMDWPIMVDSLDVLGVWAVPTTLLINEAGVVRAIQPRKADLDAFLAAEPVAAQDEEAAVEAPDIVKIRRAARDALADDVQDVDADALRDLADSLTIWGSEASLNDAIDLYRKSLKAAPGDGSTHFHLGVALRRRYESSTRRDGDFDSAIRHWRKALDIDPNQYIWRRRIQQFGPRLDKPYPFYDWVERARREITERGETPPSLVVEPRGAEIAQPARSIESKDAQSAQDDVDPDAQSRITLDQRRLVRIESVEVDSTNPDDAATRVHVIFRPSKALRAHWSGGADNLLLWVDPPAGWRIDRRLHRAPGVEEEVSEAPRSIEFEIRRQGGAPPGVVTIPAHALYDICEDVDGACVYRRQNFEIRVRLGESE